MRVLSLAAALAVLLVAALLSSGPAGVRGVRVPAAVLAPGETRNRGAALPPEHQQPTKKMAAAASLDASKEAAAAGGGSSSSPPPTVFDPDRMSKRRVRRGSDPIHNKC